MPNPASEDIKDLLILSSSGLDLIYETNLFISVLPDSPDECVGIFDSGGLTPEVNYTYEYCDLQIRVRGNIFCYKNSYILAKNISSYLHGKTERTINLTRYILIKMITEPVFLGLDENKRPLFSINFLIHRTY